MQNTKQQRVDLLYFWLSPLYAEAGWYFKTGDRRTVGPFVERKDAEDAAESLAAGQLENKLN